MSELRNLVTKTARAIADPEFISMWRHMRFADARFRMIQDDFGDIYKFKFREWIESGCDSPVLGLSDFTKTVATNAVTHSLDCFFAKYRRMRIRTFRGEYPYIERLQNFHGLNTIHIEDEDLKPTDAVVISQPFSATGDTHPRYDWLMEECNRLKIPVLVDCAFWPACTGVAIDLRQECITNVAFSLSKSFPMAGVRIGIEFMREDVSHPMDVFKLGHYFNRLGGYVAMNTMRTFHPDFLPRKYRGYQQTVCYELGLEPSKTIIFGLSQANEWKDHSRDGVINRPCITKAIELEAGLR